MSEKNYLERIEFRPQWREGLLFRYLTNMRIVLLLVMLIAVVGIASYLNLPRRLNPDIKIPIVNITTVLPGAGPESVEQLLTVPLEDSVSGISGVSKVSSSSRENLSVITIEFESNVDGQRARQDVQAAVATVTDLPEDAQSPRVALFDFENQPVWQFAVVAPEGEEASLMRLVEELESGLDGVASVDRVEMAGNEKREVTLKIDLARVLELGINPQLLSGAITDALAAYPAGSVSTSELEFPVAIDPQVMSIEDLRKVTVSLEGRVWLLSDFAEVTERAASGNNFAYLGTKEDGVRRSVTLAVYRNSSFNIDRAVEDARNEVGEVLGRYRNGFEIVDIVDTADEIKTQFDDLLSNFTQTILLVALVLFAFLGIRQSLVAALAIPLVFLVTFIVMQVLGITLNFLSLFSLLLALGLLVDAAIVVITAVTDYARSGKFSAAEAGRLVFADFFLAILTTTLTTVWAFLPLLLATGIIGEFIKSIPIVVSTTLLASMLIGLFVNLPVMMFLLELKIPRRVKILLRIIFYVLIAAISYTVFSWNPLVIPIVTVVILLVMVGRYLAAHVASVAQRSTWMKERMRSGMQVVDKGIVSVQPVANAYGRVLEKILVTKKGRWLTIIFVVTFSLFSYLLVPAGFVENEFFPGEDYDTVYMNVKLPTGTNAAILNEQGKKLAQELSELEGVKEVSVESGRSISLEGGGGGSGGTSTSAILVTFRLREKNSIGFAENLREKFANFESGEVQVVEASGGPPVGADLQIKLFGEDLALLGSYATRIEEYLAEQEGVTSAEQSVSPGVSKILFVPDEAVMSEKGISRREVGFWLRTLVSGFAVDDILVGSQEREIVLRFGTERVRVQDLNALQIPTQNGLVSVTELGSFETVYNPTVISREDGKRTISVSAGLAEGVNLTERNRELESFADGLQLPSGYFWQTGGVNEENARSVQSILQAMGLSAFLIFATMVLQFGSFRKAILVLLVIPPAISGVFVLFALSGTPLSFPALIGVLALFGIVVNNSIILIEKIGQNLGVGMDLVGALVDAGRSRLEPIFFSSLTTIIGLVPITLSNPLWQGLGGAIIAGLVFSGTIMLFLIPVIYYMWFAEER